MVDLERAGARSAGCFGKGITKYQQAGRRWQRDDALLREQRERRAEGNWGDDWVWRQDKRPNGRARSCGGQKR
jgi:hypothetical protein